ncbi:sugar phosphate isomerase/epimerase family protein [Rhizobium sp. 11515TR]|uniref:sugar phosphate isomerase/epimerase family protein n=1 Tax=Rhizobium sp. 11515TR TaxID=2028343 RepID=UPI001FCEA6E4|nr:sugar phosphate isomerase/epimerase [Rhizobium sp. 11515TR]
MRLPSNPSVSLQLYSMRRLGGLEHQVAAAAEAGFRFVEPLEHHLYETENLDRILRAHGVSAPSAHITLPALKRQRSRSLDDCIRCGIRELFVQLPRGTVTESITFWQRVGTDLGSLAEDMRPYGIVLGFHNMSSGFRLLPNGQYGFEVLFRAAGSRLVWQADIAWLYRAGVNPSDWLRRFSAYLTSAHIKDQAAEGESIDEEGWSDVGAGVMVWPSLWRAVVQNGARTLVIEHDNPKDPMHFAKTSLAYVRRFLS